MNKILLFLLFIVFISCNKNQSQEIKSTENQQNITNLYNDINKRFIKGMDSIPFYLNKMDTLSKMESNKYKAMAKYCKSMYTANQGSYELGKKGLFDVLKLMTAFPTDSITAKTYNGIANIYKNKGDYPKAIANYQKGLQIFEITKNTNGIAYIYTDFAQMYLQKNDVNNAKKNLAMVFHLLKNNKSNPAYLIASHTIANIYGMNGEFDKALKIDDNCILICDSIKSNHSKVTFLDNKANCFMYSNRLDSAKYYFQKSLELDIAMGIKKQIADSYNNLGQLALFTNDLKTAETNILKSLQILKNIDHKPNMVLTYPNLVELYEKQGNLKKALLTQKEFQTVYQQMIDQKKEASQIELNVVYETQKKEKQLLESKANAEKKQNQLQIATIIAVGFLVIGFLIFRQQKLKIAQQKQEYKLKKAISKIETQNKLQEQRLSISRDLHDNIGSQLTFIISSVDNVKHGFNIDNPKLDNKLTNISSFARETIVELRDTIWAMNHNEISYEDLEIRINNYIEKAKLSKDQISFSFAIDSKLKTQKLSSVQGMNIYRTIQEAINNSIKYANSSIITVNAKQVETQTQITITDNGSGFDPETTEIGNGLQNMKKRIEEIGGKFNISSNNEGTRIEILV
jgi:signal transduction histidine kinase